MPYIDGYLTQLSQSCSRCLPLHTALHKQLEVLAAGSSSQVACLRPFMEAMSSVGSLAAISERDPRHVSVQKTLPAELVKALSLSVQASSVASASVSTTLPLALT